jgi:hypothetical protein
LIPQRGRKSSKEKGDDKKDPCPSLPNFTHPYIFPTFLEQVNGGKKNVNISFVQQPLLNRFRRTEIMQRSKSFGVRKGGKVLFLTFLEEFKMQVQLT